MSSQKQGRARKLRFEHLEHRAAPSGGFIETAILGAAAGAVGGSEQGPNEHIEGELGEGTPKTQGKQSAQADTESLEASPGKGNGTSQQKQQAHDSDDDSSQDVSQFADDHDIGQDLMEGMPGSEDALGDDLLDDPNFLASVSPQQESTGAASPSGQNSSGGLGNAPSNGGQSQQNQGGPAPQDDNTTTEGEESQNTSGSSGTANLTPGDQHTAIQQNAAQQLGVDPADVFIVNDPQADGISLDFEWTFREAGFDNELGVFEVDQNGNVIANDGNTVSFGTSAWRNAALQNGQVVFTTQQTAGAQSIIAMPPKPGFQGGDRYFSFYLVQDASTQDGLSGSANVWFTFQQANTDGFEHFQRNDSGGFSAEYEVEDLTGGGDQDFDDMVFAVAAVVDARDDMAETKFAEPVKINVLQNDTPSGLTVKGIDMPPQHGTATVNTDGTITYTPELGFAGQDTFTYTASAGNGREDTAKVTVDVDPDGRPTVSLTTKDGLAFESPRDQGVYLITLDGVLSQNLTVLYKVADSSEANYDNNMPVDGKPLDFTLMPPDFDKGTNRGSVTFKANVLKQQKKLVRLLPEKDDDPEGEEKAILQLVATSDYVIKTDAASASVSIFDKRIDPPPNVTLDARRIQDQVNSDEFNAPVGGANGWLSAKDKKSQGAFVPVNNDDDDNDGTMDLGQDTVHIVENDLLPIAIRKPAGQAVANGHFTISFSQTLFRLWKKDGNRMVQVTPQTPLQFAGGTNQIDLFLEAVRDGKSKIGLRYHMSSSDTTGQQVKDQEIKIEAFQVDGARNVPGFTRYSYTADITGRGAWKNPAHGVLSDPGVNQTDIFWNDAGPAFGKVRFEASDDYLWAFDVAIVQVDMDLRALDENNPSVGSGLEYPEQDRDDAMFNGPSQNPIAAANNSMRIHSVVGRRDSPNLKASDSLPDGQQFLDEPAMRARVKIAKMQGPTRGIVDAAGVVNMQMFGVSHIEAGFVQTLKFTTYNAVYSRANGQNTTVKLRSPVTGAVLEGNTLLDMITLKTKPNSTYANPNLEDITNDEQIFEKPWYFKGEFSGGVSGVFMPDEDKTFTDITVGILDVPQLNLGPIATNQLRMNRVNLQTNFDIFFTVHTTDTANDADSVFTQRATASWLFNGTGTVAGRTWSPVAAARVRGDARFTEKMDGERVEINAGRDLREEPVVNPHLP